MAAAAQEEEAAAEAAVAARAEAAACSAGRSDARRLKPNGWEWERHDLVLGCPRSTLFAPCALVCENRYPPVKSYSCEYRQ